MKQYQTNLHKWSPVLGCFLVFLYSWGPILSFGAFQQYYEDTFLPGYSESAVSWIGTVSGFLLFFVGILTGPIYDHGFLRWLLVAGSFLVVFGTMMTSLATKYYQIFLTQCILIGLGSGMLWIPSMSFIAARFGPDQRALAIGIATSGSSIGGIIFPIMFQELQPSIGFGWAVRSSGFLGLGVAAAALAIMLQVKPAKAPFIRQLVDLSAFRELQFMLLISSGFFSMMGYYVALVYLPTFTATHLTSRIPSGLPFYTLAVANGASTFSRIGAGLIAARIGPLHTYVGALGLCTLLAFSWTAVHTLAGVLVWTILWGMASGLIVSLPGSIVPLFTPKPTLIGTRMGMAMFPCGLGMLVGSLVGGAIIGERGQEIRWWPLQVLIGLAMVVVLLLCIFPLLHLVKLQRQA